MRPLHKVLPREGGKLANGSYFCLLFVLPRLWKRNLTKNRQRLN